MLEKYNWYRLLKVFLDSPIESFRLRELSRFSKISPLSVMNYLKQFEKEGLIKRYKKRGVPFYQALRENKKFVLWKKLSIIYELEESGLVDFLWETLFPEAIILYGSYAKGESIENSDLDLFIIGKEKKLDMKKFEKKLNKEVHLMFEDDAKKIPEELKNNLINAIVLRGYFKVL